MSTFKTDFIQLLSISDGLKKKSKPLSADAQRIAAEICAAVDVEAAKSNLKKALQDLAL